MAPVQSAGLLSYETLVHALSGAAGSVVAMTAFYPLDTVRAILQVDEKRKAKNSYVMLLELAKEEGVLSLYKGLVPVLVSVCTSNFIYFYTFHGLKSIQGPRKNQSAFKDLFLASVAGAINVLSTTPLWVVTTRLKLQGTKFHSADMQEKPPPKYEGLLDGLKKVAQDEGMAGLWSSTLPSLILVSNPGIQFMVYEALKRQWQKSSRSKNLNAASYFLMGAIAKAVSTVLTYPLQIVQSKLRYGQRTEKDKMQRQLSTLQMIVRLLKSQGIEGLYKGLEAKLLQTVLTAALMFLCYEKIAATVFHLMKSSRSPLKV